MTRPSIIIVPISRTVGQEVHSVLWSLSFLLLLPFLHEAAEAVEEGFNVFHVSPIPLTSHARHHHHLYPWQQQSGEEEWSKKWPDGGIGLKLVHRDQLNSSLEVAAAAAEETGGSSKRMKSRLRRDRARVHELDQKVVTLTTPAIAGTPGPPLRSLIISGLNEGSGEYFTKLSFGSPSTDMLVTIDTGSDLLWIQCHPCDNCYDQKGPIFNPAKSKTYSPISCDSTACNSLPHSKCEVTTCQYDVSYGDGSFTAGEFAKECLTLNSTKGKPFLIRDVYFGCGHVNQGLFIASAGLLGLGRGYLSFPSQISKFLVPKFSYCLVDRFATFGEDLGPSYLYFGESKPVDHMRFTPLLRNPAVPNFYYVQMTSISVGKKVLEIPTFAFEMDIVGRGGVILDSGTSVTRLPAIAYQAMRDEFRSKAKNLKLVDIAGQDLFDTCFEITQDEEVPLIVLHFANEVDLILPADNVLIPVDDSGSLFCLAFAGSDGTSNLSIIGNVQQQGFRIEFDLSAKARVGFTREDCSLH